MALDQEIRMINDLVTKGVLGRELTPEPNYWHWPILKREEIPAEIHHLIVGNEVRW